MDNKNGQSSINFDIASANGKGYVLYLSESGEEGSFKPYSKVNYNAKCAHVKGLKNGKTYYAYVVYIQNNAVTQMSETATLTPAK